MSVSDEVKKILGEVLQLGDKASAFDSDTALIGSLPEFDSMAVIGVITALEEHYDFFVEDDEIDGEVFETLGTLVDFVNLKLQ